MKLDVMHLLIFCSYHGRHHILKQAIVSQERHSWGGPEPETSPVCNCITVRIIIHHCILATIWRQCKIVWVLLLLHHEVVHMNVGREIQGRDTRNRWNSSMNAPRHHRTLMCMLAFVCCHNYAWIIERTLHSFLHITWGTSAPIVTPTNLKTNFQHSEILNLALLFIF